MRPPVRKAPNQAVAVGALLVLALGLIVPGVAYITLQETGSRATATVGDCDVTGSGRYRKAHCTGTWIVGGSLLEGGHVVFGTINGVDTGDIGHAVSVAVHGDVAYTRDRRLPGLLLGLGTAMAVLAVMRVVRVRRGARASR